MKSDVREKFWIPISAPREIREIIFNMLRIEEKGQFNFMQKISSKCENCVNYITLNLVSHINLGKLHDNF